MNLPCDKCKGRCCTYPVFSPAEWDTVRVIRGLPAGAIVKTMEHVESYDKSIKPGMAGFVIHRKDGTCPYLVEGKCSIYALRPKVCRDYGVVPDLPCEYVYPALAKQKQDERVRKSMARE